MRKIKGILANKRASTYIPVCIFTVIIAMLISLMMQYAFVYHLAEEQKEEIQLSLDSYITKQAVKYHDAFKQGENYRAYISSQTLVNGAYSQIGFSDKSDAEYTPPEGSYVMHRPDIEPLTGDSIGVSVRYNLLIPFEVWGRKVTDIEIPVEIISKLTERNG